MDKEEYEDHIKNVQMKNHTIKKINTLVNDMSYSSNMSSNISWLNRGLSKLTKVNIYIEYLHTIYIVFIFIYFLGKQNRTIKYNK